MICKVGIILDITFFPTSQSYLTVTRFGPFDLIS
jgi:hypothetical protein